MEKTKKISVMLRVPDELYTRVEAIAQSQFMSVPAIIIQLLLKRLEDIENEKVKFEGEKVKINYKIAKMTPGGLPGIIAPAGKINTRKAKFEEMEAMTDEELTAELIKIGFIEAPHINETGRMEKKYIYSMSEDRIAKEGEKLYNNGDGMPYLAKGGELLCGRTRMLAQHIYLEKDPEHDFSKCDLLTWSEIKNKLIDKKLI